MSAAPGRQPAFVGLLFGGYLAGMAVAARLRGVVPPGRERVVDLLVPAGGTLLVYCAVRLRRLKGGEPPQSWGWFLRHELGFLAAMVSFGTLVTLFPETAEDIRAGLWDFLNGVQMLKVGR